MSSRTRSSTVASRDTHPVRIEASREERVEESTRSEFRYGTFVRSMRLPRGCDEKNIAATCQDGILEVSVTLPEQTGSGSTIPVVRAAD